MAYRAEIEIAVKGASQLSSFQGKLDSTALAVDQLNKFLKNFSGNAEGIPRSVSNLNRQLREAAQSFNDVALETEQATVTAVDYLNATRNLNAGLRERAQLLVEVADNERKARLASAGIRETTQYPGPIGPGAASAARLSSNLEQGRLSQRVKGLNQYERPIFPKPDINREIARRSKLRSIARATAKIEEQRSKRLAGQNSLTNGLLGLKKAVLNAARSEAQARGESAAKQRELNRELAKTQQYSKAIGPEPARGSRSKGRSNIGRAVGAGLATVNLPGQDIAQAAFLGSLAGPKGAAIAAGVAVVAKAVSGLVRLGPEVAKTEAQISKLEIALRGILGSKSEEGFKAIDRAARDFNQPILDATKNFTQLSAAATANGNSVKQTETLYRALSAATKATGGDAQNLSGVLRAATQVISKGVVRSEELRGQIGDRLPGAFQLFAQATNRSAEELQKALEQGEVSADEFVTTFADFILNKFEPAALRIGESPAEAGARLTKALEDANRAAGPLLLALGAKFQDFATEALKALTPLLERLDQAFNLDKRTVRGYARDLKELAEVDEKLATQGAFREKAIGNQAKGRIDDVITKLEQRRGSLTRDINDYLANIKSPKGLTPLKPGPNTKDEDLKGAPRAPRLPTSEGFQLQQQISQELLKQFDIKTKYMQINMSELEALDFQNTRLRERLQREENLLEFQRQQALATSKYAADAELINKLFDTRLVTLRGQTEAQIQQNAAIKEQLAIQEKITELKRQEELEGLERGLRRDIADVKRRTASPFGGDEAERADLLTKQTRRYEDVINGLTASIKEQDELQTSKDEKVREAATKEIAQLEQKIALNEILLPVLDQVEQAELRQNQLMEKYGFIANEAATAMSSAVQSIVTGTGSVEQAFSDMFANIGKAFIDMATKMIAQALAMKALGILTSAFGGGASDGDGGNIFTDILSRGGLRANGGPVSANTPYVVGEKGPELFVPGASGSITNNQQFEAARASMSFYGGGSGTPAYSPNIQATTMPDGMQYVTVEQMNSTVKAGMKVAANQGAAGGNALTMNKLRNSRSQRSKIGLGR